MVPVCSRGNVKVKLRVRSRFPDQQHAQGQNCCKQRGDKRYCDKRESAQQCVVNDREHEHGNDWRDRYVRDEDGPFAFFTVSDRNATVLHLSLIHISEPTRQAEISYAVFCLKKKK